MLLIPFVMVTSNSKCIRQEKSSRQSDPLIQLITRGYSIWKPYVKWESNLILLRLAAQLVDGQKLTRGPAIYLIDQKIRVCISLLSTELTPLCLPVLPMENEGISVRRSLSSARRSERSPMRDGGRAAFAVQAPTAARLASVHACDKHANGSRNFWQDGLCRLLVSSQWWRLRIENIPCSHEEEHWFGWHSLPSSKAEASTSRYGEGLCFLKAKKSPKSK